MQGCFDIFFQGQAEDFLKQAIAKAFEEDGPDLTSDAVFEHSDHMEANITAKEDTLVAGLPIAKIVMEYGQKLSGGEWTLLEHVREGEPVRQGTKILSLKGSPRLLLRCERIILNFICHLSGIANLTARYVKALEGTGVTLLDTRKTLPGLRYPEKYAVLVGGGCNHRRNLAEILMLKDNHIDAAGGIDRAVKKLRDAYEPTPPIEVECRTLEEVGLSVECGVSRIMLDNMDAEMMEKALAMIPETIEVEISGGISLENLGVLSEIKGARKPDFVSVGRLTHSAPYADFSMRIERIEKR